MFTTFNIFYPKNINFLQKSYWENGFFQKRCSEKLCLLRNQQSLSFLFKKVFGELDGRGGGGVSSLHKFNCRIRDGSSTQHNILFIDFLEIVISLTAH